MSRKLFQEISEFKKYGNCLDKGLYEEYRNYLCKKVLNEVTTFGLANTFKQIFRKNVNSDSGATKDEINKFKKATLKKTYQTKFGQIVKDESTNLSTLEDFCDKATFIQEFKKENFDEFQVKNDLALEDTLNEFLSSYLELYDSEGWLMLSDYEKVKSQGC